MEQRNKPFFQLGIKYSTRGGSAAVVLMKTKNQLLGAYHEPIEDQWYPTSWCDDGSFTDRVHPKKLDLTTNLYV